MSLKHFISKTCTRRTAAGLIALTTVGAACKRQGSQGMAEHEQGSVLSTQMIDSNSARIRALSHQITHAAQTPVQAAIQIHRWVRDQILFGIPPQFYNMTASEVATARFGYCNTKATLFSALLRTKGIKTRLRMVDLSARVLSGLFDPGTAFVDHAITEVWLNNRWLAVDSYVVDARLSSRARALLDANGSRMGFGVHRLGNSDWGGASDSLIQAFPDSQDTNYIKAEHGYFEDIADFYARTPSARNRLGAIAAVFIRLSAASTNAAINRVRERPAIL
jgi:Transglutaminase-like superfamily